MPLPPTRADPKPNLARAAGLPFPRRLLAVASRLNNAVALALLAASDAWRRAIVVSGVLLLLQVRTQT